MEGFVLCKVPAEKRKSRTRKDKHIAVDDDAADGECFPEDILGDYLIKGEPIDLYDLLGSDVPAAEGGSSKGPEFTKASRMVNGGLLMMNRALDASNQEARMAQFRAKTAEKEMAHLREELECSRRCEGELAAREIRPCRGTVGGLYLTQIPDYPFATEDAKQTRRMKERDRDFALPQIEESIWKQWERIPVSPDMVEAEMGAADETEEVIQPTVPLNVDDNSMGGSMTGVGINGATEKIFARDFLRLAESVDSGNTLADLDVYPLESIAEDDIDRATRVDENPCDLEISYHEIDYERIAVGWSILPTSSSSKVIVPFGKSLGAD
ncbi:hypothetical protein F2Q69_00006568 [Brassica cretica]|uniref:Uncharacterized protein n=1 Tax=Brassica cretica TaxID=69181 RepID=A0A8S9PLS5_BRACR|nr:hypothetical protein F2Q69_00006568 [Brassica cretica]